RRATLALPERGLDVLASQGARRRGAHAPHEVAADAEDQANEEGRPGLDLASGLLDGGDDVLQRQVVGLADAARSEAHLGVADVLGGQVLEALAGDPVIVLGPPQADAQQPAQLDDEAGEIAEAPVVALPAGAAQGRPRLIAPGQLTDGLRPEGALQME